MGGGEWPREVELVGTWFMFVAEFNQLAWVTFRGFPLFFRADIDVREIALAMLMSCL